MILTAHQPLYLPWLGLFHKIALSDVYCFFDVVQYQIEDYNARNRIKDNKGDSLLLSVPVDSKGFLDRSIKDMKIKPGNWQRKHLGSIEHAYKKAPFFDDYYPGLQKIISNEYQHLVDLDFDLLKLLLGYLGLTNVDLVKASEIDISGKKSELVLDMCTKLHASLFIFGQQGFEYADTISFEQKGIKLHFQEYKHPEYEQINGTFLPSMSLIDLLFNMGDKSLEVLMSGNVSKAELLNLESST